MLNIQFLETGSKGCKSAVLPVVEQVPETTFNSTTDGTIATVIAPTNELKVAPRGGTFINKGCSDLNLVIKYVTGGNCEPCDDPDKLTTKEIKWVIPKNAQAPIPDGFWTEISYVLATAANDAKEQFVSFQSSYTPDCPSCTILLEDVDA